MQTATRIGGKTVVLTGGTAGLGVGLLKEIVRLGASKVFLLCRSQQRGENIKQSITNSDGGSSIDIELVLVTYA